jgi:hypothetical protein
MPCDSNGPLTQVLLDLENWIKPVDNSPQLPLLPYKLGLDNGWIPQNPL